MKPSLLDLSFDELKEVFEQMGEKPFRAGQVARWLTACALFGMTNLSKELREKLAAAFREDMPGWRKNRFRRTAPRNTFWSWRTAT